MTESDFITAINQHSGILYKILYLYVDDTEDQNDLLQEIQLQAWKSRNSFRGESRFSTWLYRVALNTVLTFQKKNRLVTDSLDKVRDQAAGSNERSEQSDLLLRAIRQLNDVDKAIITLHLEDYGNREIAEITGLSKNNVGVKLHRIKEALKEKINQQQHG